MDAHGGVNISEGRNSAPLAVTIPHHGTNSTYVHTYIHTYFFGVGGGLGVEGEDSESGTLLLQLTPRCELSLTRRSWCCERQSKGD